jgi:Na+/proline symporter
VTVGRTTFTSGLSGIWSVLLWLFCTPFYWLIAVWYRRMRHLTLADWFVERYQSKLLGFAFMLFGIAFYMVYLALGFTAIGKVGAPLVGIDKVLLLGVSLEIETVLVLVCALVVLVYGVLGGLRAAYWTDLIQGVFIIILSVLLIPAGLNALVEKFGNPDTMSMVDGFRIMHEQVPADYFEIIESPRGGEFPFHYILAITILNLVAIGVHPHMIATGGGSAKNETSARVGLVVGNFLKRFCTIGWCVTILIVLALMGDNLKIAEDPDRVWGVAAREILGPMQLGLVGLMLACLMAAMMSSASCYMLVVSALVVRNFYAAYVHSEASEKTYVLLGRIVGILVIVGGVYVSLVYMNILDQLKVAWEMPILFAAVFWVGMFWRRATKWAAWATVLFVFLAFFFVPFLLPKVMPTLADNPRYAVVSDTVTTIVNRPAAPSDVALRRGAVKLWNQQVGDWVADWTKEEKNRKKKAALVTMFGPAGKQGVIDKFGFPPEAPRFDIDVKDENTAVAARLAEVNRRKVEIDAWYQRVHDWARQPAEPVESLSRRDRKQLRAKMALLKAASPRVFGDCPTPLVVGEMIEDRYQSGGQPIYWTGGVGVVDARGEVVKIGPEHLEIVPSEEDPNEGEKAEGGPLEIRQRVRGDCVLRGQGRFKVDFLLYDQLGLNLSEMSKATLETLRLPTRVVLPFVVVILISLVTPRVDKRVLDRFYVKMKTVVNSDPELDARELQESYDNPTRFDDRRLCPHFDLEIQKPKKLDVIGFIVCFLVCFALIGLTVWIAKIGS